MPLTPFQQLLGQLLGTTTPTWEGGNGSASAPQSGGWGPGPGGMAPGQPYPQPGQGPPDYGFDLWRGNGGYYSSPRPAFDPGPGALALPPYSPQGQPAQGPLGLYDPAADAARDWLPQGQVWGVPVLPDAFRQNWLEDLREYLRRQSQWRF